MRAPTRDMNETAERALSWTAARGIAVRRWPEPPGTTPDTHVHQPILYVVDADAAPPVVGELEDWVRAPLDRAEVEARADRLLARARRLGPVYLSFDGDGVLTVDRELVILSPIETEVMRILVPRLGEVVSREELVGRIWPDRVTDVELLRKHLFNLRKRLRGLPLEIHSVRGRGLVLEKVAAPEANHAIA
ncbi:MAG: helix-turn-helix protein [Acidimicrobiales bacterium]|nr:helix-turn-helix protein [Acidimicrobiales bacterium]